jgi:hypothetical protein
VRLAPPVFASAAALVAIGALAAGCGGDAGDTARFCGEVKAHASELVTSPKTLRDVSAFIGLYERIDRVAPLEIQPHWQVLLLNYQTANTVDPTKPDSVEKALRQAYESEKSAVRVHDFLVSHCDVDLGPVATIVAQTPAASVPSTPAASVPPSTATG